MFDTSILTPIAPQSTANAEQSQSYPSNPERKREVQRLAKMYLPDLIENAPNGTLIDSWAYEREMFT